MRAGCRVLVCKSVADRFVAHLVDEVPSLVVGEPGAGDDVEIGPLVSKAYFDRVKGYLERAAAEEIPPAVGGTVLEGPGYFVAPTVLVDVPDGAEVASQEIFGPVVTVETCADEEEAVTRAQRLADSSHKDPGCTWAAAPPMPSTFVDHLEHPSAPNTRPKRTRNLDQPAPMRPQCHMDRRVLGILFLVLVLVFAVVVPAGGGRRVAGSARVMPIPGQPHVGDCLAAPATEASALVFLPPVLSAVTGTCGQRNYGEIVSVVDDVHRFPMTVSNGQGHLAAFACEPIIRGYLGWPGVDAFGDSTSLSADPFPWQPERALSAGLLGPDVRQYFSGQMWVACVVYPRFAPFRGSIDGGQSADSYASCTPNTPAVSDRVVSCTEPHRTELFGSATTSSSVALLGSSCTSLVRNLTGLDDVTAGGQLVVAAANGHVAGPDDSGADQVGPSRMVCAATVNGPRLLNSTLIGIGDLELPWQ